MMVHASQQEGAWPVRRLGDVRLALPAVGAHNCRKDPCACQLVRYGVLVDPRISANVGRPDMSIIRDIYSLTMRRRTQEHKNIMEAGAAHGRVRHVQPTAL